VNKTLPRRLQRRKQRIERRLRPRQWNLRTTHVRVTNLHYEMAERTRGFAFGGLGVMHRWPPDGAGPRLDQGCTCSNAICRTTSRITC